MLLAEDSTVHAEIEEKFKKATLILAAVRLKDEMINYLLYLLMMALMVS